MLPFSENFFPYYAIKSDSLGILVFQFSIFKRPILTKLQKYRWFRNSDYILGAPEKSVFGAFLGLALG